MKTRHKRIAFIIAAMLVTTLMPIACQKNLDFYFSPTQIAANEVPMDRSFRIGGLVADGSLKRDGLTVSFILTDTVNSVPVAYKGILPDLFKEGRGCVAQGRMGNDGIFYADQALAKHDENYMPPEVGQSIEKAKTSANQAAKTLVR